MGTTARQLVTLFQSYLREGIHTRVRQHTTQRSMHSPRPMSHLGKSTACLRNPSNSPCRISARHNVRSECLTSHSSTRHVDSAGVTAPTIQLHPSPAHDPCSPPPTQMSHCHSLIGSHLGPDFAPDNVLTRARKSGAKRWLNVVAAIQADGHVIHQSSIKQYRIQAHVNTVRPSKPSCASH